MWASVRRTCACWRCRDAVCVADAGNREVATFGAGEHIGVPADWICVALEA